MLDERNVSEIARTIAADNFTSAAVARVVSEPFIDSEGERVVRITIVLNPGFPDRIKGDDALNTLVGIHARLRDEGEERYPLIEYATEEELNEIGDVRP
jgi:hypothetical protein